MLPLAPWLGDHLAALIRSEPEADLFEAFRRA
jgi:hypothetical protein